jgi:predicted ABC-class ATPase
MSIPKQFTAKDLNMSLLRLSGKPYGLYKSLAGKPWRLGDFDFRIVHAQGDPHAPPSRLVYTAQIQDLGYSPDLWNTPLRRLALADFLHRRLAAEQNFIVKPGPEILERNTVHLSEDGKLQILAFADLPGENRRIEGDKAVELLCSALPGWLVGARFVHADALHAHIETLESRDFLLSQIGKRNLLAFIPNGAVLPRASGRSTAPLDGAVPFESPPELEVELDLPGGRTIKGMGIPTGITVIAGGGFHGKSTVLHALEHAVYPHIPGDGRELVVIDESATRVCTEEGRVVNGSDISGLVHTLPGGKSTTEFRTQNASGATSQAANFFEALELGARAILIDEDSSAVNFLVRDEAMRKLISQDGEPLVPLIDKIESYAARGISFVLVAGACGAYLDKASTILVLREYRCSCVRNTRATASIESVVGAAVPLPSETVPPDSKIRVRDGILAAGERKADLRHLRQLASPEQRMAIGFALRGQGVLAVRDYDLAAVRGQELGAALRRLE